MAQWIINGRFVFDGHAVVEAESAEEAKEKFDKGDFEFDHPTASCSDWGRHGKVEGPH